jgi:ubiquitin-like protein Pup
MAERIRKSAQGQQTTEEVVEDSPTSPRQSDLVSELDDLLNEIDEVLESNAEEFVKNYVQKGGQ